MNTYRSKQTIQAVQFDGSEIPGVTCHGGGDEPIAQSRVRMANGCDTSRAHLPHVHANVTGGMQVLQPGWWIYPVAGGPWGACTDEKFQASWEVPSIEKPTIEELHRILDSEDDIPVTMNPYGSLTALPVASAATFPEPVPTPAVPVAVVPEAPTQGAEPVKTTFPTFTD